jgi:hypothetical protein
MKNEQLAMKNDLSLGEGMKNEQLAMKNDLR